MSQREYFVLVGIDTTSTEEVRKKAQTAYRRLYKAEWRKRRKSKGKRLTIRLDKKQYKILTKQCQTHALSLNAFIIQAALAYTEKKYLPPDRKQQEKLHKELQRIAGNVQQVVTRLQHHVRYKTLHGAFDDSVKNVSKILVGYELIREQVELLEQRVADYIDTPPSAILGMSWETLRQDRKQMKTLVAYLLDHLNELNKTNS